METRPLILGIDHITFAVKNVAVFSETLQNIFKFTPKLKTTDGVIFNYRSSNFFITHLKGFNYILILIFILYYILIIYEYIHFIVFSYVVYSIIKKI